MARISHDSAKARNNPLQRYLTHQLSTLSTMTTASQGYPYFFAEESLEAEIKKHS